MSTASLNNKPTKPTKFKSVETDRGIWVIYDHEDGSQFKEYRSFTEWYGLPLVSICLGVNPDTGKTKRARGVIAIGQFAQGVIAIGQIANGYVSIGQVSIGRVVGVGQVSIAPLTLGQLGIAVAAVSQIGLAGWGVFQFGAVFFSGLGMKVIHLL